MSFSTEIKLPWPEIRIHFAKTAETVRPKSETIPQEVWEPSPANLGELWVALRSSFQGKHFRFTSYLQYLSTDFSGGFKVCSFLGGNRDKNAFQFPFSPPGPPISKDIRDSIWLLCKKRKWEEVDRENWELLGLTFLLTGDIIDFKAWVEMTKKEFGLSEDCKRFLTILGWETFETGKDHSLFSSLVAYSSGRFSDVDFPLLSDSVLKEGFWQFSGVLFDSISKGIWSGDKTLVFWEFLTGFYSDWKDWEKAKFLNVSLGKVPAYQSLRYAKKLLSKTEYPVYAFNLKKVFRGDLEEPEAEFGYDLTIPFDPFSITLIRYDREGESFAKILREDLLKTPYSYYSNLQMSLLAYREGNYDLFLEFYQKGGRLRYLPIPLYFYARAMERKNQPGLANSILSALERMRKLPVFPSELGDL